MTESALKKAAKSEVKRIAAGKDLMLPLDIFDQAGLPGLDESGISSESQIGYSSSI